MPNYWPWIYLCIRICYFKFYTTTIGIAVSTLPVILTILTELREVHSQFFCLLDNYLTDEAHYQQITAMVITEILSITGNIITASNSNGLWMASANPIVWRTLYVEYKQQLTGELLPGLPTMFIMEVKQLTPSGCRWGDSEEDIWCCLPVRSSWNGKGNPES